MNKNKGQKPSTSNSPSGKTNNNSTTRGRVNPTPSIHLKPPVKKSK